MILRTRDSLYEVREGEKQFRKLAPTAAEDCSWDSYDRMSPLKAGEPARFFVVLGEAGRVLHYRVITTSPLVEVLPAAG